MTLSSELSHQRKIASDASMGISADAIYQKFEECLAQKDLQGSILDFGAGAGNFVKRLRGMQRFQSITGADLMERPEGLSRDIAWKAADLNQQTDFKAGSFDIIVSPEVIEHLENPRAVLREWNRLLRPGGTLIFSTPNNESWRAILALILQGHFVAFGDQCYPAHITALVKKDISRILDETGFGKAEFVFTDHGSIPKFPKHKWQSISFGLLKGKRFSDNILTLVRKPSKP